MKTAVGPQCPSPHSPAAAGLAGGRSRGQPGPSDLRPRGLEPARASGQRPGAFFLPPLQGTKLPSQTPGSSPSNGLLYSSSPLTPFMRNWEKSRAKQPRSRPACSHTTNRKSPSIPAVKEASALRRACKLYFKAPHDLDWISSEVSLLLHFKILEVGQCFLATPEHSIKGDFCRLPNCQSAPGSLQQRWSLGSEVRTLPFIRRGSALLLSSLPFCRVRPPITAKPAEEGGKGWEGTGRGRTMRKEGESKGQAHAECERTLPRNHSNRRAGVMVHNAVEETGGEGHGQGCCDPPARLWAPGF